MADELRDAILAEIARLGLRTDDLPGLAMTQDEAPKFLARLREMQPGVSWRDVIPDLPAHWEPGRPESWTVPYRPLGPYDYQELPTGPAVHVTWKGQAQTAGWLDALVSDMRARGWPVHGAGLLSPDPGGAISHAFVVLERGTSEDTLMEFVSWIDGHPELSLAAVPRLGNEEYSE